MNAVAESIRNFGFKVPIIIDGDNVIICGHTRLQAAQKLGLETVPCIRADDLTPEQVKAFRLADNKTAELSGWDFSALEIELDALSEIDMSLFGFDMKQDTESRSGDLRPYIRMDDENKGPREDWFSDHESGAATDDDSEEYQAFVEKFKPKKTTDDCYTPDNVYDTVADWVAQEYGVDRACFVRPFYPGGDYQNYPYPPECVVVDNPPFSILTEIVQFYAENGVRFFLFAPTLTLFTARNVKGITYLPLGVSVTYGNGANVNTSFITNLDRYQVRTVPELYKLVEAVNDENLKAMHKELPKYSYPDNVITAAMVARWCKYGIDFRLSAADCVRITELDAQKEHGKSIFGGGFLLSDSAAAERAAAERAAAMKWRLSEREMAIVRSLGGDKQ